MPDISEENYWFRRHEAAYRWVTQTFGDRIAGGTVVDAGCGEGYGMDVLSVGRPAITVGLELDEISARHAAITYRNCASVARTNLDALPLSSQSIDILVSMQVIEHLWDLRRFLSEARRVSRDDGVCVFTTPNRLTFSPNLGRGEKPVNPFHVEEFDAAQLHELVIEAGFNSVRCLGLFHGARLNAFESTNGSIIEAQVRAVVNGQRWERELSDAVAAIEVGDFEIRDDNIDCAHDLVIVAHAGSRP